MKEIKELVRPNILSLAPYSTARDEYSGAIGVFLDANENPWDTPYNRYPDSRQIEIKTLLSELKGVDTENIFLGNGSDEAIDLIYRIFCEPRVDNVVAISPSYGMYKVAAATNDVEFIEVRLDTDFQLDSAKVLDQIDSHTKVIFLCSPNNPSGNLLCATQIEKILNSFDGIVVIDEAYIDFAAAKSYALQIGKYPKLIVLQTLSKAWGLAGLRLGIAMASSEIIALFSRIKYPYNIGSTTQQIVADKLRKGGIGRQIEMINAERDVLAAKIAQCKFVQKVFPSDSNFLLVRVDDANALYNKLIEAKVIVRNRTSVPLCENCLRITIGTEEQNARLVAILSDEPFHSERSATIERVTRETNIEIKIDIDNNERWSIDTGIKFLDHMLDQIVHHAGISLQIKAIGDLQVDEHHTMEDVAIVFGEAIHEALGSKRGIERYGFALPMDEARALVLLDFGGRIDFEWDVHFARERVGDVPTEMFAHFFKSFAAAAHCNLHVSAKGENDHHIIEGVFKAFARALKMAVRREPFAYDLPSSKGIL